MPTPPPHEPSSAPAGTPAPTHRPRAEVRIDPGAWQRVLAVLERLAASSNLDEVLGLIIDSMRDCLHADRASVFQYDKAAHELFATRAHGVDRSLRFSADLGLAGEAVRTGQIVDVPDCYADPRFNREIDRQTGYRTRCMLTVPLVSFDGALEGVAQVLNKREDRGGVFDDTDRAIARGLASQAAVAIRRARLIEAERRKDKIEADLRVARELQQATLPAEIPRAPGYDLAALTMPADETGGDTFDIFAVGAGLACDAQADPDGRSLLLLMADATGHGVGPALSVTQVQAMLRMAARLGTPLETAVAHLNAQLCETLPMGRFVTAFVGVLDASRHAVRYVSAGQAPILVVRADGGFEERNASTLPLGIDAELGDPACETLSLNPGDVFVLLSDGYYERSNPESGYFGLQRVVDVVRAHMAAGAPAIADALGAATNAFAGGARADDDQTAIIIKRLQ